VRNVGRLGGPRRDRAQAWHHEVQLAAAIGSGLAIVEQPRQDRLLPLAERLVQLDEVAVLRGDAAYRGIDLLQRGKDLRQAELRSRTGPAELEDLRH